MLGAPALYALQARAPEDRELGLIDPGAPDIGIRAKGKVAMICRMLCWQRAVGCAVVVVGVGVAEVMLAGIRASSIGSV